jgi:phosphatidylinositol alpha 1,6-mannosyltransferase
MDLFVFPSHTDTFGNVVLEALASGVPALVTPDGGPSSIVQPGKTGLIVQDEKFSEATENLLSNPEHLRQMRINVRNHALRASWDAVFEKYTRDTNSSTEQEPLRKANEGKIFNQWISFTVSL